MRFYRILAILLGLCSSSWLFAQQSVTSGKINQPITASSGAILNQTAPLQGVTLFVPNSTDSLYRITVYAELNETTSVASFACPSLSWTDDSHSEQTTSLLAETPAGETYCATNQSAPPHANTSVGGVVIARVLGDSPVTLSVTTQGDVPGASPYSIFFTVERLPSFGHS